MEWEEEAITGLKDSNVDLVAYLPDTALSGLIERVEKDDYFDTVPVSREEEAVGVLSGAWLGGKRGVMVCQSSGLVNTFNAMGSLNKATRIPFLGIVTHRGDLGDHNLAHRPAEYPLPKLLDTIGIRNHRLEQEIELKRKLSMAAKSAFSMEEPYVLLLERTLTEDKE